MPADDKSPADDPVIDVVKRMNAGYNNADYAKRTPVEIGGGRVYTVVFKGGDWYWYENYVYERGQKRLPYTNLRDMLFDRNNNLIPSAKDPKFIRLIVVAAFTLLLTVAVICIVIWDADNPSLQVLTGLLGLGIGYFVGTNQPSPR